MSHWSECNNISFWHVAFFGHSFIKEYMYGKNQVSDTGPLGLDLVINNMLLINFHLFTIFEILNTMTVTSNI